MTRCGIGPKFSIITVLYGVAASCTTYYHPGFFLIRSIPFWFLVSIGTILLAVGLFIYLVSLKVFNAGYKKGRLVTEGPFSIVRHPIYASWILLVYPGLACFFRSWLMFGAPLVAFIFFKIFIHEEEKHLAKKFGRSYQTYRENVNQLFPFP